MKYASITDRLAHLGGAKWALRSAAVNLQEQGHTVLDLTIGEPDAPTPANLQDVAIQAIRAGRTGYSEGRGESVLLSALAERYSRTSGRRILPENVLCLPGTQTALYATFAGIVEAGDEVLVGDPIYASYESVVVATGACMVPVPLSANNDFRMDAATVEPLVGPRTRALLINSPHNPTGAVLSKDDIKGLGDLAIKHNLWIVADEVYEEMLFDNVNFASPLFEEHLADRTVVVSSISKSHAAAGFRSGWCIGPAEFCHRVLPLSETMLFGNQPFIADMTARAVASPSTLAVQMSQRYSKHAALLRELLDGKAGLHVNKPEAGMFLLVDVSSTGLTGEQYAYKLLEDTDVAVMPGSSFGNSLTNWIRLALTVDETSLVEAGNRIANHAAQYNRR